jgi:hypothetical protein
MGQPGADQNIDANPLGPPPQSSLSAFTLMAEIEEAGSGLRFAFPKFRRHALFCK